MVTNKDAFVLYNNLKNIAINTGNVDKECLSQLLSRTVFELKKNKASAFVDRLYTVCMQYACFPSHNKKTMPEIRVKPTAMGMSATDAMLMLELISMKIANSDCEQSEIFNTTLGRLFSSYQIKPSAVKNRLQKSFDKININLRQQGALSHFGKNADLSANADEPETCACEANEEENTENSETLKLYDELRQGGIEEGMADEDCLSEFLDKTLAELRLKKSSPVIDKLYTACMQYVYFPEHNKKTFSEMRIRPVHVGMSATDAMLIFEMLYMKVENNDCENDEEFADKRNKLFTSYVIKPSAIKSRLGVLLEKMNNKLCQQGALAHFGGAPERKEQAKITKQANTAKKEKQTKTVAKVKTQTAKKPVAKKKSKPAKSKFNIASKLSGIGKKNAKKNKPVKAQSPMPAQKNTAPKQTPAAKATATVSETETSCNAMIAQAEKEAQAIIARAKARERVLVAGEGSAVEKTMSGILASLTEANKNTLALQEKLNGEYVEGFARDMLELYNIMADSKDSLQGKNDAQRQADNLNEYMEMIEDMLAKYGISTISTNKGEGFSGTLHEVKDESTFDPKKAVVEKSIRKGFKRGDVVLQKERINIGK